MGGNGEFLLGGCWQCEHGVGGLERVVHAGRSHAMPGNGEKSDAAARQTDVSREVQTDGAIRVVEVRYVDEWDLHGLKCCCNAPEM